MENQVAAGEDSEEESSGIPFAGVESIVGPSAATFFRNKVEFAVGWSSTTMAAAAGGTNDDARQLVAGFNMGQGGGGRGSGDTLPLVGSPSLCSNVAPAMKEVCGRFSAFLQQHLDGQPGQEEEQDGGERKTADRRRRCIWRRLTLRGSSRTGEMMALCQYDAAALVGDDESFRRQCTSLQSMLLGSSGKGGGGVGGDGSGLSDAVLPHLSGTTASKEMRLTSILVQGQDGNKLLPPVLLVQVSSSSSVKKELIKEEEEEESGAHPSRSSGGIHEILVGCADQANTKLYISPAAFFQVSTIGADRLYHVIGRCCATGSAMNKSSSAGPRSTASPSPLGLSSTTASSTRPVLLDLCCGSGSIGITLARQLPDQFSAILGVELCGPAVADAVENAARNGVEGLARFVRGRAEEVVPVLLGQDDDPAMAAGVATAEAEAEVSGNKDGPGMSVKEAAAWLRATRGEQQLRDVVAVVDPPRMGMHPAVCRALRACPAVRRVVFVSCNPTGQFQRYDYVVRKGSLVDNAALLCGPPSTKAPGNAFRPSSAAGIDQFPLTPHCELCAVFERRLE